MENNYLDMSDDDISNMSSPPETDKELEDEKNNSIDSTDNITDGSGSDEDDGGTPDEQNDEPDEDNSDDESDTDVDASGSDDDRQDENVLNAPDDKLGDAPKTAGKSKDKSQTEEKSKEKSADASDEKKPSEKEAVTVDYKKEYEKIMSPIKANGKLLTLNNADEVIKLVQMGANYTKKMQQLQPHMKLMKMLEKNDIDEDKLSLLIDLEKKEPEAIKKFLKDKNIDPLDIDTSTDVNYKAGNHKVSDNEIKFQNTVSDIAQSDHGSALIVEVNRDWDDASKDEIYKEPAILEALAEHKSTGIYEKISQEVVKQKALGNLSELPFIHAYHVVGKAMKEHGLLDQPKVPEQKAKIENKQVLSRQARTPKPVLNGDKAKAASPNRGSGRDGKNREFNPLALTDEEFLKQMENRL